MARRSVLVHLITGEPRLGGWCDACLLPSVVEVDALALLPCGVTRVATFHGCVDCGDPGGWARQLVEA
jgi:hypothetical protein